jgi:CheY-like chemotaxis protein
VLSHSPDSHPYSVLVVDQSKDTREVLRAALERRGVRIIEACGARQGVQLARRHRPQVIVLDLDAEAADEAEVCEQYDEASRNQDAYLVVLGRSVRFERSLPKDRIVPKPYHYAPLIRTIEQLLTTTAPS